MSTPLTWQRPDLSLSVPCDSIFFDVDGVLINTTRSFRATDIAVAEYVAGTLHGLEWVGPLISQEDVSAFKQAGGYNNDWDMCYLLAALATARLREWRGSELATRSVYAWADLSRIANLQGHGGREWVDAVIPASARCDYQVIGDLYHEYYWGASEYKRRMGREPHYLPDFAGFVHAEEMLFAPDFMQRLRQAGIAHLGMITGRVGPEVDSALERLEHYCGERWWDIVVPADLFAKPDPQALRYAIAETGARAGLYIGDTADDFDLVRLYHATRTEAEPEILAAMLIGPDEDAVYQQRGADLIVRSVESLLTTLPALC